MKLNLLPQTVRVGAKSKTAWICFVLMVLFGIGACAMMIIKADASLKEATDAVEAVRPTAEKAYNTSNDADAIIKQSQGVLLNISLAQSMLTHNQVYPALYEDLFHYNPPYFRLTSISATPIDATQAIVTMTGTIETYQQYADLMLALMRNKRVTSVTRAGFNFSELLVPPLVPTDQIGKARKPNTDPIPDDPLLRLAYYESTTYPSGYRGIGNYGSPLPVEREAMPDESLITVIMTVNFPLETPSPMSTLSGGGGASVSAGAGPTMGRPGGPGGPGGAPPATTVSTPSTTSTTGGGKKGDDSDG